jgi:hypothetical protein
VLATRFWQVLFDRVLCSFRKVSGLTSEPWVKNTIGRREKTNRAQGSDQKVIRTFSTFEKNGNLLAGPDSRWWEMP